MENKQILIEDASVPVVVLKLNHHGGLAIARSLGRLGVSIYGINSNAWAPGFHSRYCREKFIWDIDSATTDATVQFLLNVAEKIGKHSLLIHTTDEIAVLLSDYANVLSKGYIFPHLSPQLVRALASKKEMYFLAKKYEIPTAETYFPQSRDDVEKYLEYAMFPVMLKGIYGSPSAYGTQKKIFITKTKRELLNLYELYEDPSNPNFMLQEYIPGGEDSVWMFNGYFNERSECLFSITGKKIRQTPTYTGATSLGICLRNDTVEELTRSFMKSIGYRGILDIGYRYDKRDGKYKVLDINPRIGTTFRLFVGNNGLDVVRAEYLDLTGQYVPQSQIVEGRKWFIEDLDLISSIRYYYDKKLTFKQWMKSFCGIRETGWFACDDLLPFFMMCQEFARKLMISISSTRKGENRRRE